MDKPKRIHFVGIGGIGMSALAQIYREQGFAISGSDREESTLTKMMREKKIDIVIGHKAASVRGVDLVVNTSAVGTDNPELKEAAKLGIPVIKRSGLLGELAREKRTVAIAGTHGKTTTTAMCAHIMYEAKLDPTVLVGGIMQGENSNYRIGKSPWLVVEADEYDRSFLDMRPYACLLNNLDADHLDCYKNLDDLIKAFAQFANACSIFGTVVVNADDKNLRSVAEGLKRKVVTFGTSSEADYCAANPVYAPSNCEFEVRHHVERLGEIRLQMIGQHNMLNALGAAALALEIGIAFDIVKGALESFRGTERRFQILLEQDGIIVVDDYAHHPKEIEMTLQGARNSWPSKRIVAIFQPHLFSRTRDFMSEFGHAFERADVIVITEIYAARENPIAGISGERLAQEIEKYRDRVMFIADIQQLTERLRQLVENEDLVIFMGAGSITHASHQFADRLKKGS